MKKLLNHPWLLHLSILAVLITLGSVTLPSSADAECLGCPPVAWHVEAVTADETIEGYLRISGFLAKRHLDVTAERESDYYLKDYLKQARIWRWALTVSHIFDGTCLERPWIDPRQGDQPDLQVEVIRTEPCQFTLPSRHLLLVGPGEPLVGDDLLSLRDKTGVEGPIILKAPVFQVTEASALELAQGPRHAVQYSPSDGLGTIVYCFAFESGPEPAGLEKLCQTDPESETWPTIEGDGWLMLVDHPGT